MKSIKTALAGIAFAAAAAGFAAGPAGAQSRLEQTGDGYGVVHDGTAGRGDVAGGRAALLLGGGDDRAVLYTGPDSAREGRFATLSGGGDDAVLTHADPPAPASTIAGGAAAGPASGERG
jgi:hypothetical protein